MDWVEKLKEENPLDANAIQALADSGDTEEQIIEWLNWL